MQSFQKLFNAMCDHEYIVLSKHYADYVDDRSLVRVNYFRYRVKCTKCGKVKPDVSREWCERNNVDLRKTNFFNRIKENTAKKMAERRRQRNKRM